MTGIVVPLRTLILSIPAVVAVTSKVAWGVRPQGQTGAAVYLATVSDMRELHLKGAQKLRKSRVQIDCYDAVFLTAKALAEAIVTRMQSPNTVQGVTMSLSQAFGPRDLSEQNTDGTTVYRQSLDLMIWHNG